MILPTTIIYKSFPIHPQRFIEKNNSDPVKQVYDDLAAAWGEKDTWHKRRVVWPIYMRVGRY
jgi:hypothetical protein